MRKKLLAIATVCALAMTSVVGCTSTDTNNSSAGTDSTKPAESGDASADASGDASEDASDTEEATTTTPANEVDGDASAADAFVIWSWNTEIGQRLQYWKDANPDKASRIVYVNTGGSDYYQDKLDAILADPTNAEYPDIIGLEADYILKYTNSEYTQDVKALGITDDDIQYMYQYTLDTATADGTLKGLSWQAAPGAFTYRADIAKDLLDVETTDAMQEKVATWDGVLEVAKTLKDGGVSIFSGVDDVKRVYLAARQGAWVVDDTLQLDDSLLDYMDFAKALFDGEYTNQTSQWSDAWNQGAGLREANGTLKPVFAYFGCTWFLQWTIKPAAGDDKTGTYGQWNMVAGPQAYSWGGTWLGVTKDCSDTELAVDILRYMTCDIENLKTVCTKDLDYVNNTKAVEELLDAGEGKFDFLANDQNYLEYFYAAAKDIKVAPMCAEDQKINSAFDVEVEAYVNGKKDKDTAIADFKKAVLDTFSYLNAD